LDEILARAPDWRTLDAIISWMQGASPEIAAAALPHVLEVLSTWNDGQREGWIEDFDSPTPHPLAPLLRRVSFDECRIAEVTRLFASPNLSHLTELIFFFHGASEGALAAWLDGICGCPHLGRLRDLTVCDAELTDADVSRLVSAPAMAGVQRLSLQACGFGDAGVAALGTLPALSLLDLEDTYGVTPTAVADLRAARLEIRAPADRLTAAIMASLQRWVAPAPESADHRARFHAAMAYLRRDSDSWRCDPDAMFDDGGDVGGAVRWEALPFTRDGALSASVVLHVVSHHYLGGPQKVQVALAELGLCSVLDDERVVLSADSADETTDLIQLCRAFSALRAEAFFARPYHRMMTSYGWEDAREACDVYQHGRQALRAVFWNYQGHPFDARGDLTGALCIQWAGPKAVIAAALSAQGLNVDVPEDDDRTFVVRPAGA